MTRDADELLAAVQQDGRRLFRVACGILNDASLAEDMVQQALLKAWQQRQAVGVNGGLRGWLHRVVVNESLVQLRRRRAEQASLTRATISDDANAATGANQAELREELAHALMTLPEQTRLVVVLRTMAGYSGNEVRQMLNCSAAQVSQRLHDGLASLRPLVTE